MEKLRVGFDREGSTLSVWFDDPKKEHVCEESDEPTWSTLVIVRNGSGTTTESVGFERKLDW